MQSVVIANSLPHPIYRPPVAVGVPERIGGYNLVCFDNHPVWSCCIRIAACIYSRKLNVKSRQLGLARNVQDSPRIGLYSTQLTNAGRCISNSNIGTGRPSISISELSTQFFSAWCSQGWGLRHRVEMGTYSGKSVIGMISMTAQSSSVLSPSLMKPNCRRVQLCDPSQARRYLA